MIENDNANWVRRTCKNCQGEVDLLATGKREEYECPHCGAKIVSQFEEITSTGPKPKIRNSDSVIGECDKCQGEIQVPADGAGQECECPHCGARSPERLESI
jgi:predicted RNA-binding Zn-ribbon protein involved in translation (DUF1610 family)